MCPPKDQERISHNAIENARAAKECAGLPQCRSTAYTLAFQDNDLLLRDELRPIRLQLELLKPELIMDEFGVRSTVVIFGSARTKDPEIAAENLAAIEARIKKEGRTPALEKAAKKAERDLDQSRYYGEARRLAALISRHTEIKKMMVITGGGPGIMEAANRGAADVGAKSIGLNIALPFEQQPNAYITPELCFQFHYFAIRKMLFLMRAKSLVAFPGGFGTMDELFEALTLIQTHKIKPIPVLLFGREFWEKVINFEVLIDQGTISAEDVDIFQFVDSAEIAWQIIKQANHL